MVTVGNVLTQTVAASGLGMNTAARMASAFAPKKESKFGEMGSTPSEYMMMVEDSSKKSETETVVQKPTLASQIMSVFCTIFAIYLAYKCSSKLGKLSIVDIVAAVCCSPCYIVYRLAKPC